MTYCKSGYTLHLPQTVRLCNRYNLAKEYQYYVSKLIENTLFLSYSLWKISQTYKTYYSRADRGACLFTCHYSKNTLFKFVFFCKLTPQSCLFFNFCSQKHKKSDIKSIMHFALRLIKYKHLLRIILRVCNFCIKEGSHFIGFWQASSKQRWS